MPFNRVTATYFLPLFSISKPTFPSQKNLSHFPLNISPCSISVSVFMWKDIQTDGGCTEIFVISDFCPKVDLFEARLVWVNQ